MREHSKQETPPGGGVSFDQGGHFVSNRFFVPRIGTILVRFHPLTTVYFRHCRYVHAVVGETMVIPFHV